MIMSLSKALLLFQLFTFVSAASLRGSSDERDLLIQPQPRIINGNRTPEGRYSYAVSLKDDVGHFCGGSLIAPDVVLSAAHCAGGDYKAIIGRHSLQGTDGEEMIVKTEMMHPSYDSSATDNDFMLIFLERPVTIDVDLVTVSPDVVAAGTDVTVMGWGDTDKAEDVKTLATELLEVEVTTMTNEECALSKSTEVGWEFDYNGQITDNMMCAENVVDMDSCQGDSGGPLVIRQDSGDDLQVGVVSWGIGCAHNDFPGVYARISAQYDWIQKNVCEGSAAPPSSFDCGSIISTSTRSVDTTSSGGFTEIVQEEFGTGFGLFNQHGNDASHYLAAKNRNGVVRIQNGANGISTLKSNQISLENTPFTKFKVDFSFYAIEMEHSDDFCVSYEINDGVETGEKCWSSLHSFQNHVWNNDKSFEFSTALDAHNLRLTFQVKGDDDTDDVLLDSVTVYGQA